MKKQFSRGTTIENRTIEYETTRILRRCARRQRWIRLTSVLASILVFVTTYAMILPAITASEGDLPDLASANAQGSGSISVSKVLEYAPGMQTINGERIYFALVKDGEYVTDANNKIVYREMFMQGESLNPSSVTFSGLEDGEYEVWEMHGDPNNGSLNRSYDGMLLKNDTVQIDKIRVIDNSNGQQTASGLYNNNATIKNGSSESMTFKNTYVPASDITSFEANKVWMDRKENVIQAPEDATIVFTLYKEVGDVTAPTGQSIVLNGISDNEGEVNPWQAVFSDLPKEENGQKIKYKVQETKGWTDYYVCKNKGKNLMRDNEYLETSGGTIYNRHLLATIQIQKHFDIQPNKYEQKDWDEVIAKKQLSFELTNETTNETWYFTLDDSFTRDGQLFYLNVPDMQAGHYVLKEYRYKGLISERKWDRGITEYERDINPGDNMDNPLFEMQVQNWYVAGQDEPEGAYVRALKVWDDLDDYDGIRPESITVKLQASVNGETYPLPSNVPSAVALNESNNWNTGNTWYNLPIVDDQNRAIEYTVTEENVPEGYTCTTSVSENGTDKSYTFTNKHRPEGVGSLKLKKIVHAPDGVAVPSTYYFTVKDAAGKYYTGHSVSGPDGHYTAIPIQAGAGEDEILVPAGTYTISEIRDGIEVPNCTLTVSGEGDYTVEPGKTTSVTITNNYEKLQENAITVQKKWVDPDDNPVNGDGKSATVQLRRYHYVSDGGGTPESHTVTVNFQFTGIYWDGTKNITNPCYSTSTTVNSSGAVIQWSSWASYDSPGFSIKRDGERCTLTLDEIIGDPTITINCDQSWPYGSFNASISPIGNEEKVSYSLEKDDEFTPVPITLAAGSWSHTWSVGGNDADHSGYAYPATDNVGNKYLYYIEELDEHGNVVNEDGKVADDITLHSITYQPSLTENRGISSGLVTVTNTVDTASQSTDFQFSKIWRDALSTAKESWPQDASITVTIWQAKGATDETPVKYATYKITADHIVSVGTEIEATNSALPKLKVIANDDNTYTFRLEDLPEAGEEDGAAVSYIYYVSENSAVSGYQDPKYYRDETNQIMGATRAGNNGMIANDIIGYVLPSTGGSGTGPYAAAGALLVGAAGTAGVIERKRRRRRARAH